MANILYIYKLFNDVIEWTGHAARAQLASYGGIPLTSIYGYRANRMYYTMQSLVLVYIV